MTRLMHLCTLLACTAFGLSWAQAQDKQEVKIYMVMTPDGLNPATSTTSLASTIQELIFASLLEYDPNTLKLRPYLAKAMPKIEERPGGGMALHFEIRPEAIWDNGQPVTAADVVFSVKSIKNPKVNASAMRPYLEFIEDIVVDEKNPKKFSVLAKENYFSAEESLGTLLILPEYRYDPERLMRRFSFAQLRDAAAMAKEADIEQFAKAFNGTNFERNPDFVLGCGPYSLNTWEEGKQLILKRRANWWGDKVKDVDYIKAHPLGIHYVAVADQQEALKMVAEGKLDIMANVRSDNFAALQGDPAFTNKVGFFQPEALSYQYLAFNTKNPKLADKRVRQAFAHLINREEMIQLLFNGQAVKVNGPVAPAKAHYNKALKERAFDLDKAKALLAEAGWKDSDNNKILDRMVDGKLEELVVNYKYNKGNYIRQEVGLMLQEEAAQVGIKINLEEIETGFFEHIHARNFELACLGWIQSPGLDDLKQIWHSSSDRPDGSNYVGFAHAEMDQLIDDIRATLDDSKRLRLYLRAQEILHEELPYVFLFSPQERILISKRFKSPMVSVLRPGYQVRYLK